MYTPEQLKARAKSYRVEKPSPLSRAYNITEAISVFIDSAKQSKRLHPTDSEGDKTLATAEYHYEKAMTHLELAFLADKMYHEKVKDPRSEL